MDMVIREKQNSEDTKEGPKRMVTLDVLRGIAIFGVTLVHISYKMYDPTILYDRLNSGEGFPFYTWILIGVLGYFGTWHGFFLFISAIVNSYVFTRKAYQNISLGQLMLKNTVAGLIIVGLGYLIEGFGYYGYFGNALRNGEWDTFRAFTGENFWIQTLQIIGIGLVINGIIQYFLYRNNGYKKYQRNLLIYAAIALVILSLTPIVNFAIENHYPWTNPDAGTWPDIYFISGERTTAVWFLNLVAGAKDPLMPYLTTAAVGAMIGIYLGRPKPEMRTLTWFSLAGVGLILIGGIFVVLGFTSGFRIDPRVPFSIGYLPFSTIEEPPAISTYMIRLGGQICLLMLILRIVEFRGKGNQYAKNPIWKFFRRWSYLSLTIYSMQIYEIVPRAVLKALFYDTGISSINFMQDLSVPSIWMIVLIVPFVLIFFEAVIIMFYRFKLVGSFEWIFVSLQNLISQTKSAKLHGDLLTDSVQWVSFKEDIIGNITQENGKTSIG